jgi:hypothetical protein
MGKQRYVRSFGFPDVPTCARHLQNHNLKLSDGKHPTCATFDLLAVDATPKLAAAYKIDTSQKITEWYAQSRSCKRGKLLNNMRQFRKHKKRHKWLVSMA